MMKMFFMQNKFMTAHRKSLQNSTCIIPPPFSKSCLTFQPLTSTFILFHEIEIVVYVTPIISISGADSGTKNFN